MGLGFVCFFPSLLFYSPTLGKANNLKAIKVIALSALVLNNSLHFRVFVKRSHLEVQDHKVMLNYLIFLIRRQRWLKYKDPFWHAGKCKALEKGSNQNSCCAALPDKNSSSSATYKF